MYLKILNALVLSLIIVFSVTFGITQYDKNAELAAMDATYQKQQNENLQDLTRKIYDDIAISQGNKTSNRSDGKAPNPGGKEKEEVSFTNFNEMFNYAIAKLNRATYIYSSSNGAITVVEGGAMGVTLKNETLRFKMVKAKKSNEKYFGFDINVNITGIPPMAVSNVHYTNDTVYAVWDPFRGASKYTGNQYADTFGWNIQSPFHLPNQEVAAKLIKAENVLGFEYNESKDEYKAIVKIDGAGYDSSNFGSVISGLLGSKTHPKYRSLIIEMVVDGTGSFKSISYDEHFDLGMTFQGVTIAAEAKMKYTEFYTVIDNGFVNLSTPEWAQ